MRKAHFLLIAASLFLCATSARAQNDGTIVEQVPCTPNPVSTYEQYLESSKRGFTGEVEAARQEGFRIEMPRGQLLSKGEFERERAYTGFECRRIKYLSDGLKVVGYIWKPKNTEGKKLPLIIFNHGGSLESGGKVTPWMGFGFYHYVSNGFVVIGPQYRGIDGGEGREEFGGADVDDVLNLIPLAKSLGYVDMNNVFIFGASRGGMETYLALKRNIPVNAVAVVGGWTNLIPESKRRPTLVPDVWSKLIPDFNKRGEELMRERSAVNWAEKISVPVLLIHGGADWRSDISSQALAFAQRLQELGKTYELIIYANDNHGVALNREDRDRRIVEWFRRYMK